MNDQPNNPVTIDDDAPPFPGRVTAANRPRYLPYGVKQDSQWRVRMDQGEHTDSVTVQLSGAERGTWKNETTGKQGASLLTVIHIGARHDTLAETLAVTPDQGKRKWRQGHNLNIGLSK